MTDLFKLVARLLSITRPVFQSVTRFLDFFSSHTVYLIRELDLNFHLRRSGNDNNVNRYATKCYGFLLYRGGKVDLEIRLFPYCILLVLL